MWSWAHLHTHYFRPRTIRHGFEQNEQSPGMRSRTLLEKGFQGYLGEKLPCPQWIHFLNQKARKWVEIAVVEKVRQILGSATGTVCGQCVVMHFLSSAPNGSIRTYRWWFAVGLARLMSPKNLLQRIRFTSSLVPNLPDEECTNRVLSHYFKNAKNRYFRNLAGGQECRYCPNQFNKIALWRRRWWSFDRRPFGTYP